MAPTNDDGDPFKIEESDESTTDSDTEDNEPQVPVLSPPANVSNSRVSSTPDLRDQTGRTLMVPSEESVPLGSPRPGLPLPLSGVVIMPVKSPRHSSRASSAELPPVPPPHDDTPGLFIPGLISPSLFLPIPNTDPLSVLLNKYIDPSNAPVRDLSGAWSHSDFHTLVMTNSWRAVARMARDSIVAASPNNLSLILDLWYLRLCALARLRLFNQTSAECANLFSVLVNVQPDTARDYLFENLLPFELEVMRTRTKYWAGDIYGYLDELAILTKRCKRSARACKDVTDVEMWKERAVRMGLLMASQFLEMRDHAAAASILLPLCSPSTKSQHPPTAPMLSAVARVYIEAGDVDSAKALFDRIEADPTCDENTKAFNRSLLAIARYEWQPAIEELEKLLERDPENAVVLNNLSVALLSIGRLDEGVRHMEKALATSPSLVANVETFLFNLSTLYELRTAASHEKKRELLLEVSKWAGDGLRASCLKFPTS